MSYVEAGDEAAVLACFEEGLGMAGAVVAELARLPVAIVDGLHVLGFESIGDIEDTPKAPLTHRFGPEHLVAG